MAGCLCRGILTTGEGLSESRLAAVIREPLLGDDVGLCNTATELWTRRLSLSGRQGVNGDAVLLSICHSRTSPCQAFARKYATSYLIQRQADTWSYKLQMHGPRLASNARKSATPMKRSLIMKRRGQEAISWQSVLPDTANKGPRLACWKAVQRFPHGKDRLLVRVRITVDMLQMVLAPPDYLQDRCQRNDDEEVS